MCRNLAAMDTIKLTVNFNRDLHADLITFAQTAGLELGQQVPISQVLRAMTMAVTTRPKVQEAVMQILSKEM